MNNYKGLRNAAYVCQRLALIGGVLWVLNCFFFFAQFFSAGLRLNFHDVIENYGGATMSRQWAEVPR